MVVLRRALLGKGKHYCVITVIDVYVASAIFQSYNPEGRETEERNLVNTMFSQIDCVLFSSRSRIFHSHTDVTISSRLQNLGL